MINKTTYSDSGVNIELGNEVSKILYNAAKKTWNNRKSMLGEVIVPFDDFSGVRAIDVSNLQKGTLMNIGFDGIGTKIEFAERINNHETIAYDLFAMVCDDAIVRGAEPVLIGSNLGFKSLGNNDENYLKEVRQLAKGYVNAAKAANVAVVNGETAELGNRIGGYGNFNYNWDATVVWFAKQDRLFTGKKVQEKDYIVGLKEEGFRSNGLSLVRKILFDNHGINWHEYLFEGESIAKTALKPSRIYSVAVIDMFGGYSGEPKVDIHGIAHITGGGLPEKLGRVLKPSGLGAKIDDPFEPSNLVLYCQEKGNVSDEEAYKTWNMGQGMTIITPEPEKVMDIAFKHDINSKIIGTISSKKGIDIISKGYFSKI
ncbi:MAG: AIR synthase-related protein [archaeon]